MTDLIKCTFCGDPNSINELRVGQSNSGIEYACQICVYEGYVYICDKCNKFERRDKYTGPIVYDNFCCYNCRNATMFQFKVGIIDVTIIKIPLPKDKEAYILTNYFYHELSKYLNVPMNHIRIKQMPPNLWIRPNNYDNPSNTFFDIFVYNCKCGQCCQCDYVKQNITYNETDKKSKYNNWLWRLKDNIKRNDCPPNWR